MNTIELARQLGHAIQAEECYKKIDVASAAIDADEELTGLIAKFGQLRDSVDENTDEATYEKIGKELESLYNTIMSNEKMVAFEEAKEEFGVMMDRITAIITKSANGEDPDTAEPDEGCDGDCCSCGHDHDHGDHGCSCGCH